MHSLEDPVTPMPERVQTSLTFNAYLMTEPKSSDPGEWHRIVGDDAYTSRLDGQRIYIDLRLVRMPMSGEEQVRTMCGSGDPPVDK